MSRVVIDTSVWSLGLRRSTGAISPVERSIVLHWRQIVQENRAILIGPIRQELLTGIRLEQQFERLAHYLRGRRPITRSTRPLALHL